MNTEIVSASCIITFHREGLLAHTTLTSIALSRQYAEEKGLTVEFIITLDNNDTLTEKVVRKHPCLRTRDVIEKICYGDPGLARNHAVHCASGDYVVVIDGDDYYSRNYIFACVMEAVQNPGSVIVPEYCLSFGQYFHYLRLCPLHAAPVSMYTLFLTHPYVGSICAKREILQAQPYVACPKGFGPEDWHWNCEARAAGFHFRSAPLAVRFYRRKSSGSMLAEYERNNSLIPSGNFFNLLPKSATEVFESPNLSLLNIQTSHIPHPSVTWKTAVKSLTFSILQILPSSLGDIAYRVLKRIWHNLRFARNIALRMHRCLQTHNREHNFTRGENIKNEQVFLREALLEVAKIDGLLHPDHLPELYEYIPYLDEMPGRVFAAAWHALPVHKFDIVYTAYAVNIGGADRMTLNYIHAALSVGKKVLCICTGDRQNKPDTFPKDMTMLDLGLFMRELPIEHQYLVIARFLLQLSPEIAHIVNDWKTFTCLEKYGQSISSTYKVLISLYSDNKDKNDISYGGGTQFLRSLYPYVTAVITDNQITARNYVEQFGVPDDYFYPVYGIVNDACDSCGRPKERARVLWAGRFDFEKRLDIAYAIVQKMPDIQFDFYGTLVLDNYNPALEKLQRLTNVTLCGKYDNFFDLPISNYFALLYTTQFDGLPNVILEAAAAGLPVVAPDCGGIRDFITNESGWLIDKNTDIEAYVIALRQIQNNPLEAERRWGKAHDILCTRHTPKNFSKSLFSAYGWNI